MPHSAHAGRKTPYRTKKIGGAKGGRTPDLVIANDALYQLSYDPNLNAGKVPEPYKGVNAI
jgi:hypothetical protein